MAAIFQLRRGSGSVSMVDGELYVNKGPDSLQYSVDEKIFTVGTLNETNIGSFSLTGDITASNAYFTNNVTIDGKITVGNETGDTLNIVASLSSSLVPSDTKVFNIGSNDKWYNTLYSQTISASFISGAIAGIGNIEEFSASVDNRLDQLQLASASLQSFTSSQELKNETLAIYTASINADLEKIHQSTASLNLFSASEESKNETLAIYTASINSKFTEVQSSTASLNTFSSSALGRLGNLESKSASVDISLAEIHSYTSSLKTALGLSGQDVTVLGNLTVNGTTTQVNSTQVNIGENILELNFGGSSTSAGIYTKDATGASLISGSILWDSTTDYWKAGKKDLESKILLAGGDGVLSGSIDFSTFSASVDSRLTNLQIKSASVDISITNINNETASIEGRFTTLATYTGSIDDKFVQVQNSTSSLNSFSASTLNRLDKLEINSASVNNSISLLNIFSGSQESKDSTLATYTSSIDNKFIAVQSSTASLNTFSASVLNDLTAIHQTTASLNLFSASINVFSSSIFTDFSNSYDDTSASFDYRIRILDPGNLSTAIDSLNLFTASTTIHLTNLETKSASVDISISSINSFTSSANGRLNNLELTSASINAWSSSLTTTFATDAEVAAGYESQGRGIVSGSSQLISLLPSGVVSGSSQVVGILNSLNSYTQSNDTTNTTQNNRLSSIEAVTASLNSTYEEKASGTHTLVSGSSQILGGTNIHSGSIGNYQFNSIGVGISSTGVAGEIVASGDIVAFSSSDIRFKENIKPIENALEKVNKISGNTYDWKEGYNEFHSHKGNDVGVIAQEIETILPQIVTNRDTGFKAVQYEKIIPLLIEAIKELSVKINILENK